MSMNPLNDISAVYLEEVLKPQLGKEKPESKSETGGSEVSGGSEDINKKARQLVYDIKYEVKKQMGGSSSMSPAEVQQAYLQGLQKSKSSPLVKTLAKKMLMGGGKNESTDFDNSYINEDSRNKKSFKVRVRDKQTGNTYVTNASREKISQLRSNPNISSVEMTKYGEPIGSERYKGKQTASVKSGKGLDPVGKEDSDVNNDGKVNKTDKYLQHRRNVRGSAIANKKSVKEAFSNWRDDLREVVDDEITSEKKSQIKGMKKGEVNHVDINPKLSEGIELLESLELSEDYIFDTVNIAAEYFVEHGLNEYGVDILIEELGLDEFVDFVFQIKEEDLLTEARAGGVRVEPKTKTGKHVSQLKGGARTAAIARLRKEKASRKESESKSSESKPSGLKASLQRQSAVANAAKQQPKKKGVLDRVAGAVLKGMERHRAATSKASELASQTFKTAKKAAGKVGGVAKEVGSGAKGTTKLIKHVASKGLGEELELQEKITAKTDMGTAIRDFESSKSSQLAGRTKEERRKAAIAAVLTARRGGKKLGEALDAKIQDQPTPTDNKVRNVQSDTVKKQQLQNLKMMQQKKQMIQRQELQMQRSNKLPLQNNSYEPDGEVLDELRRSEKEGKGSVQSPPGFRGQNRQRGSKGGRHFWSGGEGGSRIERGKSKNEPGSQHQRLNPPEKKGRQLQRGSAAAMQRWHSARD